MAHVLFEATQEAGFRPHKAGLLQPPLDSDGRPQRASLDRPADVWILARTWPPKLGISGSPPVSAHHTKPSPTMASTQNLAGNETLKRTFHDTANRCHHNGIRFTPFVFNGHTRGWGDSARNLVIWISHRLSTSSPRTPSDIWLSASLQDSTVTPRVPFCDGTAWLPRETTPSPPLPPLGSDSTPSRRRRVRPCDGPGPSQSSLPSFPLAHRFTSVLRSRSLSLCFYGVAVPFGPGSVLDSDPHWFVVWRGATASTCSSSRTSGSDLLCEPNTWNELLNLACHFEIVFIRCGFWFWNGAPAISGTCQFSMMLAPTCRLLAWPIYLSSTGLLRRASGNVSLENLVRAAHPVSCPSSRTRGPLCRRIGAGRCRGLSH